MPEVPATTKTFIKHIFVWIVFIALGLVSVFSGNESTLAVRLNPLWETLFGMYYQFIFSPIIILMGVFITFRPRFILTFPRFLGLLLFFVSSISILGFFRGYYESVFNFSDIIVGFFWQIPWFIFLLVLFLASLYILFQINYKKILSHGFSYAIKVKDTISLPSVKNSEPVVDAKVSEKNTKHPEIQKELAEIKEIKKSLQAELSRVKSTKPSPKQMELDDAPTHVQVIKKESPKKNDSLFDRIKNSFDKEEQVSHSDQKIAMWNKSPEPNFDRWVLPKLSLLDDIDSQVKISPEQIRGKQNEIVEKLRQFKIEVTMKDYRVGPTVTQFRLSPEEWVKLNKIENLKKDLTLALHAKSIRIQAPIPWEWVVGIEVPNDERSAIGLKEVLKHATFANPKFEIPLSIGKDVNGNIIVGDLTKMPHLLVAWQTASGKSVGMNGFILSMLYKFTPNELKLIMVDPKRVELSIYNGIPHLLAPVITDPDKALNSLKWGVAEMLRRYDLASSVNARNIREYNEKVDKTKKLPYIVVLVDELADLMMSGNKKEVESSIARIAQMGRAAGMHLIIATQRPSVDVITGIIKANIPSRIAFTVASQIDSRTIIDKAGAEDLLGFWDMLYAPTGSLEPERVQGVLVKTEEIEAVVNQIKLTVDPDMIQNLYDDSVINGKSNLQWSIFENYNGDQDEDSELIEKAIQVVRESKKGSTSLIQRKLWLGYARAAKVLDILEELWVVGPSNGSKPREVYENS